ncbi:hypothetical protein [Kitasatospora viridis]|uniref:Uncharacterized protein n=1 Tax=Kitasatospora viridis TaxID=281105 RepID=A0A561SAG1_9ACTN|nr:hypothetical protein [Kitasatospora viridis]TWF71785.1 hypothetical protein FHX73_18156 [Kitasatospora viridis]
MIRTALDGVVFCFVATLVVLAVLKLRQRQLTSRPRPVLPEHPPYHVTYVRADGDPALTCSCHRTPVHDGDDLLIWPAEEVLCKRTFAKGA